MAIIVEDIIDQRQYFLLGASLGIYKTSRPSILGGSLFPYEEEGSVESVAVCDNDGKILFIDSERLRVVELDGIKMEEISKSLSRGKEEWSQETNGYNVCPACGVKVHSKDETCIGCGLRLLEN